MLPKSIFSFGTSKINVTSLMCLALLWCQGSDYDKAETLFEILNPPGEQNQDKVAAQDKEWDLVLKNIFEIATKVLVELALKNDKVAFEKAKFDEEFRQRAMKGMHYSELEPDDISGDNKVGFISLMYPPYDSILTRK